MAYKTENALETFGFKDAYLDHFEKTESQMDLHLEGVIVRGENENNSNYTDSYAKEFVLSLQEIAIKRAYKEGFKYYNADDVLIREIPNEEMEPEAFLKLLKMLEQPYFYGVRKLSEEEGKMLYEFGIEERGDTPAEAGNTYWFEAAFTSSLAVWEGYLNRVQY